MSIESRSNFKNLNLDAWSDGQVRSKLWLCQELEKLWGRFDAPERGALFWIYGSWYGTLAQFLLVREKIKIFRIDLFDIDPEAVEISRKMTNMWWHNQTVGIGFHAVDCGKISTDIVLEKKPDLLINTSCEHFQNYNWFYNLPKGQRFLVQSTNMLHPTHILCPSSISDFKRQLGDISEIHFEGSLAFHYVDSHFDRFMIVGVK